MDLSRGQKVLVICGLVGLLAGIAILSLAHLARRESPLTYVAPPERPREAPRLVAVHVVGAVRQPGMVWLPPGSRVMDAVARAGGLAEEADEASVNLAAVVSDGQQIVVGARPVTPAAAPPPPSRPAAVVAEPVRPLPATPVVAPAAAPVQPLSLNQATKSELEALPGIGPQLAQRILYYRHEHGGFRSVEDLTKVEGIDRGRLHALAPYVRP